MIVRGGENISPGVSGETWNNFDSIHHSAHRGSNRWGSYTLSICIRKYQYNKGGRGIALLAGKYP